MDLLSGKVAIVSGGALKVGKEIALALVKEGAKVVIIDSQEKAGLAALEELKEVQPDSTFIQADPTDHEQLENVVNQIVSVFEKLNILVTLTEVAQSKPFLELTQKDFDLAFNTQFYPSFSLMKTVIPHLKITKGNIINVIFDKESENRATTSMAAQEGVRAITRGVANEFGESGITANLISATGDSSIYRESAIAMEKQKQSELEIGRLTAFLASENSKYISGQTIHVND